MSIMGPEQNPELIDGQASAGTVTPPPAHLAPPQDAYDWARIALYANPDAATPADATLAAFDGAVRRIIARRYPCAGDGTALSGDEALAYAEGYGRLLAAEYARTPSFRAANNSSETTVKVGPVTRTQKNTNATLLYDPVALAQGADAAFLGILCVALAREAGNSDGATLLLSGRRREIDKRWPYEPGGIGPDGNCLNNPYTVGRRF